MSTVKYPNRDELRKAHDIYLDAMSQFVSKCLNKDIEENIEISRIAYYVRTYWDNRFESEFDRYYEARSATQLIVEGRNRASHPPWDLDLEFTRTQLFLIAELLGKIGRSDAQREVEIIRDKLFSDDTAERLAEAEQRLAAAEAEKKEYKQKNTELSEQVDAKEKQRKKLDRQVKNAKTGNDKLKKELASTKKRLKKSEEAHNDDKESLETKSKELKDTKNELTLVQGKKSVSEKRLAFTQNLLITAAIGDQSIYPALDTNSRVRMLDRRGTDKRDYLLELLEQKQPAIIYVQGKDMVNNLLRLVGSEKASVIGKLYETTPEAKEKDILEKLESSELIAVVTSRTVATLLASHGVEHFVFCHLSPDLDAFFERCRPVFTSTKDAYLHLIYNSKEDTDGLNEWLTRKYPTDEVLRNLYKELKDLVGIDGDFFDPEDLYNKLNTEKLGIETGFDIFEELHLLERNKDGIKLLPPSGKKLKESKIFGRGEELKLKDRIAEVQAFQLERSLEEIWEEILEKINVNTAQILRESNIDKINTNVSEVKKGVRPATKAGQSGITLPTVDVWPQRGMSAFNNLRHQITKGPDEADIVFEESTYDWNSPDDVDSIRVRDAGGVYNSPVLENQENYRNKYELAIQFIQEYGINALEEGIAQLIKDRDDPDYNFTEDETNMLRAFQDAFWNSRAQSQ